MLKSAYLVNLPPFLTPLRVVKVQNKQYFYNNIACNKGCLIMIKNRFFFLQHCEKTINTNGTVQMFLATWKGESEQLSIYFQ